MANRTGPVNSRNTAPILYRYALLQWRDAGRAEDVVPETLLAAIEGGDRYAGRASVKTWLTGILKHKITDLSREQSWETPVPEAPAGEDEREFADQFFDQAVPTTGLPFRRHGKIPSADSGRSASGKCSNAAAPSFRHRPRAFFNARIHGHGDGRYV